MSKTIGDKLEASKSGLDALLTYANGVTGQDDVSIGDAVKTLADGFGQGGGGPNDFVQVHNSSTDINDVYVDRSGNQKPYAGWAATDWIPCDDYTIVIRNDENIGSTSGTYCAVYDKDKKWISSVASVTKISPGWAYLRFSGLSGRIRNLKIWVSKYEIL